MVQYLGGGGGSIEELSLPIDIGVLPRRPFEQISEIRLYAYSVNVCMYGCMGVCMYACECV